MEPRRIYIDTSSRQFVASPDSTIAPPTPLFFAEDVESIELFFLKQTGDAAVPYSFADYSGKTVKLAIGVTQPAALQTTWSALSTTVTVSITTLTNGGGGSNEVQKLTFSQEPAAGGYSLQLPSRNVTVSSVSASVFTASNHGLLNGQSVTITGFSFTGSSVANGGSYYILNRTKDTFSLASTSTSTTALTAAVTSGGGTITLDAITTGQISYDATATDIAQAFISAGIVVSSAPQIIVTGSSLTGFTFTFANSQANINFSPLAVVGSTLAAAAGLSANLSLNTSEIAALIAAGTTSNLKFEVEVSDGAKRQTYQTTCSLSDDIVSSTSPTPAPANNSFTLQSPNGSTFTITVDNDGVLTTTEN